MSSRLEDLQKKDSSRVLKEVATATLEDWAMMLTETSSAGDINQGTLLDGYLASLNLRGAVSGEVIILATKEFAQVLHQNLAGDSEVDIQEDEVMDCLREMANITAGKIVTEVFGENVVFDLTDLSCVHAKEHDLDNIINRETSIILLGDDCPVCFSLIL